MPGFWECITILSLGGARARTQDLVHSRQALYQLCHMPSPQHVLCGLHLDLACYYWFIDLGFQDLSFVLPSGFLFANLELDLVLLNLVEQSNYSDWPSARAVDPRGAPGSPVSTMGNKEAKTLCPGGAALAREGGNQHTHMINK